MVISNTKFHPIIAVTKNKNGFISPANPYSQSLKNVKHPSVKMDVLIIGISIEHNTIPNNSNFLFLKAKNNNPEKNPAAIDLSKHIKIVPNTDNGINTAIVSGVKITAIPFTNPRNKPHQGPSNNAPTAIGIKDKLIVIGPTLINRPSIYNTTSIADNAPVVTIHLILSFIRFMIIPKHL